MNQAKVKVNTNGSNGSALSIPTPVMFKIRRLRALYELQHGDKCTITRAVELAVDTQLRMFGAEYGKDK